MTTRHAPVPLWKDLEKHAAAIQAAPLKRLFAEDPARFEKLSFRAPGMLVDFSKQHVTAETLRLLLLLAKERKLDFRRHDMFSGAKINLTENRAVLHAALRAPKTAQIQVDGENVVPDVHRVLDRMAHFANAVRTGHWRGHSGKEITDIVSIGIGGSSLGPQLVTEALAGYHHMRLKAHFAANVEASELHHILQRLSPETTLFLVASKTFTTAETMQNAQIARDKVVKHFNDEKAVEKHFVAMSTNAEAVEKFGILPENMFPFRDWVGGRFSVWSSIGLAAMILAGPDHFMEFLAGAHAMDAHFQAVPPERNLPILLGLVGLWNRNFLHRPSYVVAPYHSGLRRFPAWLQQVDMESNGKSVDRHGDPVPFATGPLAFGEPGTDSQHSFFQWLHQGTDIVPVDFIAAVKTSYGTKAQQHMLLANCLAQSEALMNGKDGGKEPHRNFPGNRPSTTILLDDLSPRTLGSLMALYEHKIFVQGAIWDINSFDQFGVELGKVLAKTIGAELDSGKDGPHDSSTSGLMAHIRQLG